jgi:hypothetical protein
MAMVVYKQRNNLPVAIKTAISGMNSIARIIKYVKSTGWYLAKANNARRAIISSLTSSNPQQTINAPVARSTQTQMRQPRIRAGRTAGSITLTHREYLGEIEGATTFAATAFAVNPGLHSTFPWMAGIANSFEYYKILSMNFEFVSIAATSERGRIALAFEYDALDETPTNKVDLFQIAGASEANVWSNTSLSVKQSPKLFTRVGPVPSSDLKTYDHGKLIAGVSNTATTVVVGELFVSYVIELITPQPSKCPGAELTTPTGVVLSPNSWLGSTVDGSLPITVTPAGPTFPIPGDYIIAYTFVATVTNPGVPVVVATIGAGVLYSQVANDAPGLKTVGMIRLRVLVPNGGVQISSGSAFTGFSRLEAGYSNSF